MDGRDFRVADEVRCIQRRAAGHTATFVAVGPLAFFSTETGDAWMLDPSDHVPARVARDGAPESIHLEETDADYSIAWPCEYAVDGELFVYTERDSGRTVAIFGYPTARIGQLG